MDGPLFAVIYGPPYKVCIWDEENLRPPRQYIVDNKDSTKKNQWFMSSGFPLTIIRMPLVDKLEKYFSAAPTAQTEEFMFQNVAYRATVYRTGVLSNFNLPIISE